MRRQGGDGMRGRLALYALGALAPESAREIERHVERPCDECAGELRGFEAVALALGAAGRQVAPPPKARERLLTDVAGETARERPAGAVLSRTIRAGEGEWEARGDGVFVKRLFEDEARGTVTSLYRLSPGARCAGHRHLGVEECFVLEGDFRVNGEALGAGDYHCSLPGSVDETLVTEGGALLLIVAQERYEAL